MAIPDVMVNVKDGQLGLTPPLAIDTPALVGPSSLGTVGAVLSFGGGNVNAVKTALGVGPLADLAAMVVAAGASVITCKATTSSAGSAGAVGAGAGNTSTSVMTLTGTPTDTFDLLVSVVKGAAAINTGVAQLQVSLDGGLTFGPTVTLPVASTYVVPDTGLTLNFATGTLVAGDIFTSTCVEPRTSSADYATALTALTADPRSWFMVGMAGVPADSSGQTSIFGNFDSALVAAAAVFRYARGMIGGIVDTDANVITSMVSLSSTRVGVGSGKGSRKISPLFYGGPQLRRPAQFDIIPRLASVDAAVDAAEFDLGPLPGVTYLQRDENTTPGLDDARVSTLRTFVGQPGFYIGNARYTSPPTSDFQFFQAGRVMDIACAVARAAGLPLLSKGVLVNSATGTLSDTDAKRIQKRFEGLLRAALTQPGRASDVTVVVDQTNNILVTNVVNVTISILPLGYIKKLSVTIGFFNPALLV